MEDRLTALFEHLPIVVVTGARQVGKSTLLKHLFPEAQRVVFDPVLDVENARADPDLFLQNRRTPLILDEIQYAPQLVPALKRRLDKDRKPSQYLITGSQQWEVMKALAESLAGRAVLIDLWGFSAAEISPRNPDKLWLKNWLEHPGQRPEMPMVQGRFSLYEQLWRGFLPECQTLPLDLIPSFHASYVRTYIERDVRLMAEISDLELFSRFYRLSAALSAQEINYNQMGRDIGLSPPTAKRWLQILKHSFQWVEIPSYARNAIKKISGKPKGYFADTGLLCWAQGLSQPQTVAAHPLWGAIFETVVVMEILKQCQVIATPPILSHWRQHSGAEVDLILDWNGRVYPIEIKAKTQITKKDAQGIESFLRALSKKQRAAPGLILAPIESPYPVTANVWACPWA